MTRALRTAVLAGALLAVAATPAAADLQPITLLSANAREQAVTATVPTIAAGGGYVAFQGTLAGVSGVFRRNLATGDVELVAGGSIYADAPDADRPGADASAPSISADGRYVSFTTTAPLRAADDTDKLSDVYVRDMDAPRVASCAAGDACPYELASAPDGSDHAIVGGATAASGAAVSADGRHVAFVTLGASDLTSGPSGSTPGTPTPAGQVAVRDLDGRRTTLVSAVRDASSGAMTGLPVPDGAVLGNGQVGPLGATISADGSTVAWLGLHVPAQAPTLRDEATNAAYNEPLWRRIADGPSAPTRRMIGGGDPLAPGCPADGTLATPACQGPFTKLNASGAGGDQPPGWISSALAVDGLPRLSADGRAAVLVGNATQTANAFLVDMHDGLTRREAVRPLTRETVPIERDNGNPPTADALGNASITGASISPDGRFVAFTSQRQQFPLAPPSLVTPPPTSLGLAELYRVDLGQGSMQRVTPGTGGGPSAPGATQTSQTGVGAVSPSFSADDRSLVFASDAANLVPGDANQRSDAFLLVDRPVVDVPGVTSIGAPPAPDADTPERRLTVSAVTLRDGTVNVHAVVPDRGTLRVAVTVPVAVKRHVVKTEHVRRHGRRVAVKHRKTVTIMVKHEVAAASKLAPSDGPVAVGLRLKHAYRQLARQPDPLAATAKVSFADGHGPTLKDDLAVRFHAAKKTATKKKPAATKKTKPSQHTTSRGGR